MVMYLISRQSFVKLILKDRSKVKQIRNVICVVLNDSSGALTGREVYFRLKELGYSGSLEATNRALYRMVLEGRLFSVGGSEKYYTIK